MNESLHTLEEALAALPRELKPSRDLWPLIRTGIETETRRSPRSPFLGWWGQLAAGVALMVAASAITYVVTRNSLQHEFAQAPANTTTNPRDIDTTSVGAAADAKYLRARADLDRLFAERIASLPPATRAKLQGNLAELRHAADEITATLAEHPADSLLQELLQSTRRRELQLLADVSQMPIPNS